MLNNKKIVVVMPAYNAASTLEKTYREVPLDIVDDVILVDDKSSDRTSEVARNLGIKHVITHERNTGYGGNQKLGYRYAIDKGFDAVALLHGDGQYAPEKLPELVEAVLNGSADAVFGSRMIERGAALKNGMPLYKYVGNKILTSLQNKMLGLSLSEFHSGYRIYSTTALASPND